MRRALLLPLSLVAAIALAPQIADACSCMRPPPPQVAARDADAVFELEAVGSEEYERKVEGLDHGVPMRRFEMKVIRVWKGLAAPGATVFVETARDSATCGRSYETGTKYLVYARATEKEGSFRDGLCSRTRASDRAQEDFDALGEADGKWVAPEGLDEGESAEGGTPPEEAPQEPTTVDPFSRDTGEQPAAGEEGEAPAEGDPASEPQPAAGSERGCSVGAPSTGALALFFVPVLLRRRRRAG